MSFKPELLAPAGNRDSLIAAIQNGADAVYFGLDSFNARMRAGNFTKESAKEAITLSNAYGVKTYITLNTRLFDDELDEALRIAADSYEMGASGFIIADMGLAFEIRRQAPNIEIHSSTQLSGHSIADAIALKDAGFSRMVCHREITADNLRLLVDKSPIEIEMFVHGAHCVSFSGQCLMSAMMGGRSGNRGECAQPCRQCYSKDGKDGYPLSLKDMCLASHIKDFIDIGVSSLKIEGRQKPANYVGGVVSIYRRLLDENRNATDEEIQELYNLFNREGFTDGYLKNNHRNMTGVRLKEDYTLTKAEEIKLNRKVPCDAVLNAVSGKAPSLTLTVGDKIATVISEIPTADIAPLTEEGAKKNVSRLGSTPFELRDFKFITDGKCPLPLSQINAMRREACEKLLDCSREKVKISKIPFSKTNSESKMIFTAEFLTTNQVTEKARKFFSRIYLPEKSQYGISLLPYQPDGCEEIDDSKYVLVHSASELLKYKDKNTGLSLRGNVFNSKALEYYASLGAEYVTASPEMRLAKIRDMSKPVPVAAVIYGRLPLMLNVRCTISDGKRNCKRKSGGFCYSEITDRYKAHFPVVGMPDCTNIIYNSVPIYMADKMDDIRRADISVGHFIFTTEKPEEIDKIIDAYINEIPSKTKEFRRLTF